MQNVEVKITRNNRLVLTVDLNKETGWTTHARSIRIASTEGNLQLWKNGKPHPKGIRLNLNVFRSLTEAEREEADRTGRRRGYY